VFGLDLGWGSTTGGEELNLNGGGFFVGMRVFFGAAEATVVSTVTPNHVRVRAPSTTAGTYNVTVQNVDGGTGERPNGWSSCGLPTPPPPPPPPVVPTITAVSPSTGLPAGGTLVTVTGTGFSTNMTVALGGAPVNFTLVSPTQLTFVTAPGTGSALPVSLVSGASTVVFANAFSYSEPVVYPSVTLASLTPSWGPTTGTLATLTGTGFTNATQVQVGWTTVTRIVSQNESVLVFWTPTAQGGACQGAQTVSAWNPTGPHADLNAAFTFTPGGLPRLVPSLVLGADPFLSP
jgi:hypothetical protein